MKRAVVGRMPLWADEGKDVETAMVSETEGAEYRRAGGHQGLKGSDGGKNNPDGADEEGLMR